MRYAVTGFVEVAIAYALLYLGVLWSPRTQQRVVILQNR